MSKIKLGKIPDFCSGYKDAAHAACIAAYCTEALKPGQSVKITDEIDYVCRPCDASIRHGIVDPFLTDTLPAFTIFWLVLEQSWVGELRHDFKIEKQKETEEVVINECQVMGCN